MIHFFCPGAGASIKAAEEKTLRRVECWNCREAVLVPLFYQPPSREEDRSARLQSRDELIRS
jgi:hypothetical protein